MRILKPLAVVYLAAVLALTLWPNLAHTDVPQWARLVLDFANSHGVPLTFNVLEATANVIMFVPFGILGVWLLGDFRELVHPATRNDLRNYADQVSPIHARPSLVGIAVQITLLGLLLSVLIETTQLALPGRVSALDDILHNSLGALLGALIGAATLAAHANRERRVRATERRLRATERRVR